MYFTSIKWQVNKKEEVQAFFYGSQIFVYIFHVFIIAACILYDTNLKHHILNHDYLYCLTLLILTIAELYLLRIAGQNPGIVAVSKNNDLDEESIEMADLTQDRGSFVDDKANIKPRTSADINPSIDRSTLLFDTMPLPRRRYCELCRIEQPYRTKHCSQCEACVAKYDHHCFWIGGCVGELNLRKFFTMLVVQNITYVWLTMIVS